MKGSVCSALIGTLFMLGAATASAKAEDATIVIHTYPGALISLYARLGVKKGFYKAEGLDASTQDISTGPEATAALAGGSINFVLNTSDNLVIANTRGFPAVAVVGNQIRNFYSLVVSKDVPLEKIGDLPSVTKALIGKRVGDLAPGTNNERFAQAIFTSQNIDLDTVTFVPIGTPPSALAAFSSGKVDAHFGWEPFQTIAKLAYGAQIAIDCRVEGQCPPALTNAGRAFQVFYTSRSYLEKNPEVVAAFVRAQQKIDKWAKDPANRAELISMVIEMAPPPSGIDVDAKAYAEAVIDASLPSFGTTVDPAGLEAWNKQLLDAKVIDAPVDVHLMLWENAPRP